MKAIVQRVSGAKIVIGKKKINQIGKGFVVLLGVTHTDTPETAVKLSQKISKLRIMADSNQKMNQALADARGEVLIVSQFTLYANTKKGNRPSFMKAAPPAQAEKLYHLVVKELEKKGLTVKTGKFGAMMQVTLTNDGPVTIILSETKNVG